MTARCIFYTHGCRVNQAETAALQNRCEAVGLRVVDRLQEADIVVINTCTVTGQGDADTRKLVKRIARERPAAQIALVGCQAELQADKLSRLPNVRWVVGTARKFEVPERLARDWQEAGGNGPPGVDVPADVIVDPIDRAPFAMPASAVDRSHTRANLKIQDGCNAFCSYCAVPLARGRARSRRFEDILRDADALIAAEHREIVLTGINIGTYRFESQGCLEVVEALLERPGLGRLRISSMEPTTIPEQLIVRMAADYRLCRFMHIPLQHGSDAILRAMNRRYTAAEYADSIIRLAATVPGVAIGTDVMVGFPGETDADFDATVAVLERLPFTYFHVFSYSPREGTRAAAMAARRPHGTVVRERSRQLRALGAAKQEAFAAAHLGTRQEVLFERKRDGWWQGLTDTFVRVRLRSPQNCANRLMPVTVTEAHGGGLVAVPVAGSDGFGEASS